MNWKSLVISILIGLFLVAVAAFPAGAQQAGDPILVNQPYAQPANTAASMAANAGLAQPYSYATPYAGANAPYATPYGAMPDIAPIPAVPAAIPAAAPFADGGPYTCGFTYSAQQSAAYGPFMPPLAQASEQFYQFPGISPYGAYPGAGYAAAGGIGFDPATGYYGPYSAYTPIV